MNDLDPASPSRSALLEAWLSAPRNDTDQPCMTEDFVECVEALLENGTLTQQRDAILADVPDPNDFQQALRRIAQEAHLGVIDGQADEHSQHVMLIGLGWQGPVGGGLEWMKRYGAQGLQSAQHHLVRVASGLGAPPDSVGVHIYPRLFHPAAVACMEAADGRALLSPSTQAASEALIRLGRASDVEEAHEQQGPPMEACSRVLLGVVQGPLLTFCPMDPHKAGLEEALADEHVQDDAVLTGLWEALDQDEGCLFSPLDLPSTLSETLMQHVTAQWLDGVAAQYEATSDPMPESLGELLETIDLEPGQGTVSLIGKTRRGALPPIVVPIAWASASRDQSWIHDLAQYWLEQDGPEPPPPTVRPAGRVLH